MGTEENFQIRNDNKQSTEALNEKIGKLKQTGQKLQESKANATIEYESQVEQYQNEAEKFKKKYQNCMSQLRDNLLPKLLEAEAEYEEVTADYKQQIVKLKSANKASMNAMATNKVDTIQNAAKTIQELRESVAALSKQCEMLTRNNKELNSGTAWRFNFKLDWTKKA